MDLPSLVTRPLALSMATTSPACTRSRTTASIIFTPRSYTVSMSVVFIVRRPVLAAAPAVAGRSICSSTTSPSMTSASSLMRTPMARRKAWGEGDGEGEGEGEEAGEGEGLGERGGSWKARRAKAEEERGSSQGGRQAEEGAGSEQGVMR